MFVVLIVLVWCATACVFFCACAMRCVRYVYACVVFFCVAFHVARACVCVCCNVLCSTKSNQAEAHDLDAGRVFKEGAHACSRPIPKRAVILLLVHGLQVGAA